MGEGTGTQTEEKHQENEDIFHFMTEFIREWVEGVDNEWEGSRRGGGRKSGSI